MIDTEILRKKIIDLAIQGKLTQQLPEDGNAEDLYAQIQKEKGKLIKEGKIKKEKPLPEISDDEIPFEIPNSWKWVRIGDVTYNHGQKSPDKQFCYIDIGTLDNVNHRLNENENVIRANDAPSRAKKIVERGDVLYSTVRPYLHNICVVDREFSYEPIASTAFAVMHTLDNCILNRYLYYWLLSEWFDKYANGDSSKGMLYPAIGEKDFFKGLIPLAPFEEQIRIVDIIDAVFAQIDAIDYLQQQYESDREILKGKIIDAGIRGRLTEQLPEDGNAEDLYVQIQKEKAKLIKEGMIKKEKPLPDITYDEVLFEIPSNWKWVRIGDVTYNHGQKTPQNRFCYIDVGTLDNVNHRLNGNENIVESNAAPSRAKKIVKYGDVLYSMVRPYLHNICVVNREFSYEPIASTAFAVMHTYDDNLLNRYLYYWLLSKWFDKYANGDSSKGTLYPAIGEKDFFKGLMPLAPIEEQKRIVQRISELLYYCM